MSETTPPDSGAETKTVASADGTEIAFEKTGSGPPLVLVHGAVCDRGLWELFDIRSTFARYCTVYAMDRRGHGDSGDTDPYELEQAVDDVIAVVESIDEPVHLLGHSSGGLYALEAALRTDNLHKLLLYDPAVPVSGDALDVDEEVAELMAMLENGENEAALESFLRDIAQIFPAEIDALRSAPTWQDQVNAIHTAPLEGNAVLGYEFDASRFAEMTTPTLLLSGSESARWYTEGIAALDETLPNSRVATIDGHGHVALVTAPDRLVDEVLAFVRESN